MMIDCTSLLRMLAACPPLQICRQELLTKFGAGVLRLNKTDVNGSVVGNNATVRVNSTADSFAACLGQCVQYNSGSSSNAALSCCTLHAIPGNVGI